jgi:pseudouridine kinase
MGKIMIIGGANIDIIAKAKNELLMHDSNVGVMEISYGGVGRNIVENLARLGNEVHFLTAIGNDEFGKSLKADLKILKVDLSGSFFSSKRSGLYLALCEPDGEMKIAICDNEIIQGLNPEYLESILDYINSFDHFAIDTNLSKSTLDFLFRNLKGKIYVDATSITKAMLLEPHLSRISLLKGNAAEIAALSKVKGDINSQINALLNLGVKRVVATSGQGPVYYNQDGMIKSATPLPEKPLSTTGCGDAFMSGLIHGILLGSTFDQSIDFGFKAASATMKVVGACNPELDKYF